LRKLAKRVTAVAALALFMFVFLPFFSLLAPGRLRDYVYRTYFYRVVSEKVAAGAEDPVLVTERMLDFVYSNTFTVFREYPIDGTPLTDLARGIARCDQAGNTLAQLLSFQQVDASLTYLQGHHALARVRLNGYWAAVDPYWGVIFKDRAGNFATLREIHLRDPDFDSRRIKGMSRWRFNVYLDYYASDTPKAKWKPPLVKLKGMREFLRKTIIFYHETFGMRYFYLFQDCYLALTRTLKQEKLDLGDPDARLYFRARNYQLTGREEKARRLYNRLEQEYPQSLYGEKSRIFSQAAAMKLGAWNQARQGLQDFLESNGDSQWTEAARFYLDWCLYRLGRADLPAEASDVSENAYYFRRDAIKLASAGDENR